jgi:Transposase DNA-binding
MTSLTDSTASFGTLHFGAAQLGDIRRTRRLVQVADAIVHHPGGTLPQKIHDPTPLDALYRLADREEVTHAAVLEPHRRRTLHAMRQADGPVPVIHDTTELDYTTLRSLTGLGQIGNGGGRGYECHNALAVHAPTRTVLGLAHQILARRDTVGKGESRRARRERPTRESRLWKRGSVAVGPAPAGALWVDICDRGADVFEYIAYRHEISGPHIVRSKHDRLCTALIDGVPCRRKLHGHARGLEPPGGRYVEVAARDGQPARRAKVVIAAGAVELVAPKQPRGDHGPAPVPVRVVALREVEAPAGVEPLEWILLSDRPAGDLAQAGVIADRYGYRPMIEELHKGMKTGCGVELMQFTTEAALQPMIAPLSVVAVFLLGLRDAGRDPVTAAAPATQYVPVSNAEVLCAWRHGEVRAGWTVGEFYRAPGRLGGHQNRKSDPPPGWLVLCRGWTRLQAMVSGVEAMARLGARACAPGERPPLGPPPEAAPDPGVT